MDSGFESVNGRISVVEPREFLRKHFSVIKDLKKRSHEFAHTTHFCHVRWSDWVINDGLSGSKALYRRGWSLLYILALVKGFFWSADNNVYTSLHSFACHSTEMSYQQPRSGPSLSQALKATTLLNESPRQPHSQFSLNFNIHNPYNSLKPPSQSPGAQAAAALLPLITPDCNIMLCYNIQIKFTWHKTNECRGRLNIFNSKYRNIQNTLKKYCIYRGKSVI